MVFMAAGYSLNMLTLFGMVLAIGILVDDAIVVVENVERIMTEEGLPPKEATRKAMTQITSAIIGITLVLMSVFVPMAFFPGSVGIMYRQFSVSMISSIGFSAFLALSLTPALCGSILKPVAAGHHHSARGLFGWFNRKLNQSRDKYSSWVQWAIFRSGRLMALYAVLVVVVGIGYAWLPTGFVPVDDQGYITTDILTPPEAAFPRTLEAVKAVEDSLLKRDAVEKVTVLTGFSFLGQGYNTAQAFITLKDWSERGAEDSAEAIVADIDKTFERYRVAEIDAQQPPPIDGLGTTSGFSFRLQDRGQRGYQELMRAKDQLIEAASQSSILQNVYVEGMPPAPSIELLVDREKAAAFGVSFAAINETISTNLGSNYINDFPNRGRMQRVVVQADYRGRMQQNEILAYKVRNEHGELVPLSSFATLNWLTGPSQIVGYNNYPSVRISGVAAPGYTSGQAIAEMERLAANLPRGFGYEWTGQSFEEKQAGSQAGFLLSLSVLFVFLVLAALYESWSIPLSVLLTVPLGLLGAVIATAMRGLPNGVYFTVAVVTIIGLAAKDGILIIEFAKTLWSSGKPIREATIEACRMRFRPIIMTGLAFVSGVLPMVIATGAAGKSQQALGTTVMGGMISVVILALMMVPVFFVAVQLLFNQRAREEIKAAADEAGADGSAPGLRLPTAARAFLTAARRR
jgi:multidrug efflux pump